MKAISIRQPWAWLIVNGYKDIENRSWNTKYRGRVLVHAAKGMTRKEYDEACMMIVDRLISVDIPDFEDLQRGGIVGYTHIVNCVDTSDSPWFFGPKGFILSTSEPLPFYPMRGRLGFFDTPLQVVPASLPGHPDGFRFVLVEDLQ